MTTIGGGLDRLFSPRTLAIIGASDREGSLGRGLTENVLATFPGEVYLVNRRGGEIMGRRVFRRVSEIEGPIDLALVIIPAEHVPETLTELGERGTGAVVVYSGGFREAGREDLEREAVSIARRYGMRLLGPNCVGLIDTWTPLNATFVSRERQGVPERGHISIISQSGALGSLFLDLLSYRGLGLRRFVSVGNASDIDVSELIEYLSRDEMTRTIGVYIENMGEGRRLIETIRRASLEKPVVVLRGGRTAQGARAASSHVGALAVSPRLADDLLRIPGVFTAGSLREFIAALEATERITRSDYTERVVVITNTGGLGVLSTDSLEAGGIRLTEFDENTRASLREVIPRYMSVGNPIDLSGDAPTSRFREVSKRVIERVRPSMLIVINQPQTYAMDTENFIEYIRDLRREAPDTPVVLVVAGGHFAMGFARELRRTGVPVAEDPVELVSMVRAVSSVPMPGEPVYTQVPSVREKSIEIIERAYREGRRALYEYEAKGLAEIYGFRTPRRALARDREEVLRAGEEVGYPVVVKIVSPDIVHKSDVGGVVLGVRDSRELLRVYEDMVSRFRGYRVEGFLIEEMIGGDIELFIGGMRHEVFGPVIALGTGGVLVELLQDTVFATHDSTYRELEKRVRETRIVSALLRGYRGHKIESTGVLVDALARIARILEDNPEIREVEINPARLYRGSLIALDVRVVLS